MPDARAEHHLDGGAERRGPRRGPLLAAAALVLVALVGLGSRAPLWDIGGPPRVVRSSSYSGDLMLVAFSLLVVLPFVIPAIMRQRRGVVIPFPDVPRIRPKWWVRILSALAIAAAVGLSLLLLTLLPGAGRRQIQNKQPAGPIGRQKAAEDRRAMPVVHWWGYGLVGLVVIGGVAAAFYFRRPPPVSRTAPDEPDELLTAVELSLDDLENDPDARRAVIRAYGRMERALGSYGLARRPSETPLEYIARALTSLRVGRASVERLSSLFERAKFSQHEIDLSMKTDALEALGALRNELTGASTAGAAA